MAGEEGEVCRLAQSAELLTSLAQLYRAGHGADCGLVGGGPGQHLLPLPCHRLILAAASPFLASLIHQVTEVKTLNYDVMMKKYIQ